MEIVEGVDGRSPAGTVVPHGPTVRVLDDQGEAVAGVRVSFQVTSGGGKVTERAVTTDARGRARGTWVLGREDGAIQELRISAGSLAETLEAEAVAAETRESWPGRNGYVEYLPGTLPLVVTAPHGGDLEPVEISDRSWGTTVTDLNTRELALVIRDVLHEETGAYPHLVICHLDRVKLDANREIVEAAQGEWAAERAWWEYHVFADEAGALVEEEFGRGLYLDIHGHGHDIQRVELGYLLSSSDLERSDQALSSSSMAEKSGIGALVESSGTSLATLIRGPLGLGTLLAERGFPAVPSASQPDPGGAPYFSGGYSTLRHGSREGGRISGIQLEHNYYGLRDDAGNRRRYAEALAEALAAYFPAHFTLELAPAGTGAPELPAAGG